MKQTIGVLGLVIITLFIYKVNNGFATSEKSENAIHNIQYAPVFNKLKKGVNQDTNMPSNGVSVRIQHYANHMKAIKEAGFESVRIFFPLHGKMEEYDKRIQDALDNDLAIVICLWGAKKWAGKGNIEAGVVQIANHWKKLATYWKDAPNNVVFEILNETEGIGFKEASSYGDVMKLYNAAVKAIREVDEERPILIGPPGYNDSDKMDPWINDQFIDYQLQDGRGLFEDPNIGISIHYYNPKRKDGNNWAFYTEDLKSDWEPTIDYQIEKAAEWQKKHHTKMPIVVTEWGCWLFKKRNKSKDLINWLDYNLLKFEIYDFGNMWYTGIQSNQRQFGIFDSEFGWNEVVLNKLTGIVPTSVPPTPQLLDEEFFRNSIAWQLTSEDIKKSIVYNEKALSGNSSIKIVIPNKGDYQLYQQTLNNDNKGIQAPGRTLLHLIEGRRYKISFLAKAEKEEGQIKIRLKNVADQSLIYDSYEESNWFHLSKDVQEYTCYYTHNAPTVNDVRFEFDLGSKIQTIFLDKVVFVQDEKVN